MDRFEKVVAQLAYEKGSWEKLNESKTGSGVDVERENYNSQEEIDLQMRNMDFINQQI